MTNQSERAKDGESFVAREYEIDEAETDNEQVEAVPSVLEVAKQSKRYDLQYCLRREDRRKRLDQPHITNFASLKRICTQVTVENLKSR